MERYIRTRFAPIAKVVANSSLSDELRHLAIRRTTRHIYHWTQEQIDQNGGDRDASSPEVEDPEAYEAARTRPPTQWVSGHEPATPRQMAFLRDRGVPVRGGLTKAQASLMIMDRLGGRAARGRGGSDGVESGLGPGP